MGWKQNLLGNGDAMVDEHGIVRHVVADTDAYIFHKEHTKGAYLRKLKDTRFHQIYWETPYYARVLDEFLKGYDLRGKVILDFGCGDGRFTQYLLEHGADRIVCVDFDYGTLAALAEYVREHRLDDKVMIVHSDFENLKTTAGQFDLVIAIGVLYYLNDQYEKAVSRFYTALKEGGRLITSDPELEGSFLRMLMYDSLDAALRTFRERKFKETKAETDYRFRVFDEQEWTAIFSKAGFRIEGKHGISLFHNLIRVLMLKGVIPEEQLAAREADVWNALDYMHDHGKLSKHIMWNLIKG